MDTKINSASGHPVISRDEWLRERILAVLLPGAAWLAMPKCPVCLAGYLTLLTGFGVSAGFAAALKTLFLLLTTTILFHLAFRHSIKQQKAKSPTHPIP